MRTIMSPDRRPAFLWLIPVAAIGTYLWLIAVLSKPFRYSVAHLGILAALYLLLALAIWLPGVLASRWGKLPALAAAIAASFVLVLHAREQTRPSGTAESLDKPDVLVGFLVAWALAAAICFLVLRASTPREKGTAPALLLVAVVPLFFGFLTVSYHGSNTFRWHLLRHNVYLGALSHHLFAEDTALVRAALWEAHEAEPPPPLEPLEPSGEEHGAIEALAGAPNIVFMLIDTLRADSLLATGGAGGSMPWLDELATQSFVFTDVKANASWTFPSMGSFFTGLLPEEHGAVWGSNLGESNWTLAEAMAARGYRTAAFVANGAWMRADLGMAQGFETFEQLSAGGASYSPAEEINDAALEWLAAVEDRNRPIFLYIHYMDPHVPYRSAGVVDPASHVEARAAYEADLAHLDGRLREVFEALTARMPGRTYTLITADHGEEFGEHGERGHGRALYDEVLHIPALLHPRTATTDGTLDEKLEARDFYSLLDALASQEAVDVPAWARAHAREQRYASSYYTNRSLMYRLLRPYRAAICLQAIELDGYSLIWSGQGNTYELYDLRVDPQQLHNIAAGEPRTVTRLAAAMHSAPSFWAPRVEASLDAADLERLRALGYLR